MDTVMPDVARPGQSPIAVGIPAGAWMYTRAVWSLLQMVRDDLPPGSRLLFEDGWSSCPAKRNSCVAGFLGECGECSHLLLLDSDMVFPAGMVPRLLAHDKDVMGVLYTMRFPPFPVVGGRQTPSGRGVCYWPMTPGTGLVRVDRLGGAVLLVARRVAQAIAPPWFDNWRDPAVPQFLDCDDFYFCDKALSAGFELWCDTDEEVGHLTIAPTTPGRAPQWREAWPET